MSGESGEGERERETERGMQLYDSANQNKGTDVDRARYETCRGFVFSQRHSKFYTPGLNPPPLGPHG